MVDYFFYLDRLIEQEGVMKSYLVKWLIAIVLAVFFLWLSLETDLLPKEVYPLLLVLMLVVGLYLFKER